MKEPEKFWKNNAVIDVKNAYIKNNALKMFWGRQQREQRIWEKNFLETLTWLNLKSPHMNPHNQDLAKKQPLIDLRKPHLFFSRILKEAIVMVILIVLMGFVVLSML